VSLFKIVTMGVTGVPLRPSSKKERHRKAELAELRQHTEALRQQAAAMAEIARLSQRPLPPPSGPAHDAPAPRRGFWTELWHGDGS
jgi:hypothetical protein